MYLCTYFNSNYADKGWACHKSLTDRDKNLNFFILCLDDKVYQTALSKENVIAIKLSDIENEFPKLLKAKSNRTMVEYCFTLSPFLPMYIFNKYNYVDVLFYTDADIAFWGDPREMLEIFGDKSLMVSDHGFEPPRAGVRFNVGILGYRNDDNCKEFLSWWGERCLEWCKAQTLPNGMCGDQGYLNVIYDEPNKFKNTLICPQPGINLGPWNIAKYKITKNNDKILLNGKWNLVCYHYHEFKLLNNGYYPTGWKHSENDRKIIYDPYYNLIMKVKNENMY